jgi:HTH-type transcriptional regulator / antitoxin HigA
MMSWKVVKTRTGYNKAIKRTMDIFHAEPGTAEADELDLLLVLVKDYEDKHIVLPEIDPIDAIKLKMKEQGIKAKDLESIIGSKGHVSSILSGRRELTLKIAQKLKNYLQLPADIFMPAAHNAQT